MTKTVRNIQDLLQFGIDALTGEACAFNMRILCDVNEDGRALLADFFGIEKTAFKEAWNRFVDGKDAVGSIMLTPNIVPKLAQFAFFRKDYKAVVVFANGTVSALNDTDIPDYKDRPLPGQNLMFNPTTTSSQPHVGSRNVHAMTGRVE